MNEHSPILSATQISLWTECRRKWGFRYLAGIKPPQTAGAALGQEVQDEQLDPYLTTGRHFDFSKRRSAEIAQALVPILPAPRAPGLEVRRKWIMGSPASSDFGYQGELDLFASDSAIVPGLAVEGFGGVPLVGDVKTTKHIDYVKSADILRTDVQAMLYAAREMFAPLGAGADVLDLVWFTAKSIPKHRVVRTHLRVVARDVLEQFQAIDVIGVEVANIKIANPKPDELPPNPRMCDQYGGCPYRHLCNLSPAVFAAAVNEEEVKVMSATNAFLNSLRAQTTPAPIAGVNVHVPAVTGPAPVQAVVSAPTPAAEVAAAAAALPPWATAPVDPLHAQRQAIQAAHPAPAFMTTVPPQPTGTPGPTPAAVNPPESALPPAPPVGAAAPAQAPAARRPGRPPKAPAESTPPTDGIEFNAEIASALVSTMRGLGIKRLAFEGTKLVEIELGA